MNIPKIDLPRVVIVGCGFGGLKLAKTLNSKRMQIVLLDKNNYHTFQPLLYQVASSGLEPDSIAYPIRKVFKNKDHFHFRWTEVTYVDTANKTLETTIGPITYDYLVLATGAASNFFGMADVEKNAMPMKSLTESLDLRSAILQNFERSLNETDLRKQEQLMNIVIVGGGPTGVELAGALAELKKYILPKDYPDLDIRRMQINIIEAAPRLLATMSSLASKKSYNFLKGMGVNIWLNTQLTSYDGEKVITNQGEFRSETLIWAAGVKGEAIKGLNVEMKRGNRIQVDRYGKVIGLENVYALGDVAMTADEAHPAGLPMLASVAAQQGSHLGKNLNKLLRGKAMAPFKYNDKGTMATIGRNRAVVDLPYFSFGGLLAWMTWMFVHLMLLVDFRNRLIVFMNWAWSYFNFDKGTRLIVRTVNRQNRPPIK